jgi:hypothetical protein
MVSFTEIREALAAQLAQQLTGIQVSAYLLASPTPPTIHLYPGGPAGQIAYDLTLARGVDQWALTVQAFVGPTSDIGAQKKLDQYLAPSGPQSIKQAVESDPTLGGLVHQVHVPSCAGYRQYILETATYIGAEWYVQVYAQGG